MRWSTSPAPALWQNWAEPLADNLDQQIKSLIKKLNTIGTRDVPLANASALNKVSALGRTRVVRGISKQEKIPQKAVRRRAVIRRASRREQVARIIFYTRDVSVASFMRAATLQNAAPRGTNKKGVRAAGRQFNHAFVNKTKKGQYQVFRRVGKSRTPLEVVKIPIRKAAEKVVPVVTRRVMASDYRRLLLHELNWRLTRREKR
jgi:hypothetical protein